MASSPTPAQDDQGAVENPRVAAAAAALTESLSLAPAKALEAATLANEALTQVSSNKAVFPLRDWEKTLSKLGGEHWLGDPQWGSMRALIARQIGLLALSQNQTNSPWALYTPERLVTLEREMIELAKRQTDDHPIPREMVDAAFARHTTMAEEQRLAAVACSTGRNSVVVTEGTAGAGKSFTLNAIREVYEVVPPRPDHPDEEIGYDIIGTALSWTATKVLEASANLKGGKAIQGLVIAMDKAKEKGEEFFKRRTLLIVDEAGLVGIDHMHKLLWHSANSKHPVRVILTGDSLQLNPVMAGNALEAIVDECGSARLDTIRRQKQASHRAAVKHFCYGRAEHGLWTYWQQEAIHFCATAEERREKVMRDYVRYAIAFPEKTALVLALENKEVKTLNDEIRSRLKQVGRLIGPEHAIKVTDGNNTFTAHFCVGDQIVLRKNNLEHPVFESRFKVLHEGLAHANAKSAQDAQQAASAPPKEGASLFRNALARWSKERSPEPEASGAAAAPADNEVRRGVFNRMSGIILDIKTHPQDPKHRVIRIMLAEGGEIDIDTSVYKQGKSAEAKAEEEEAKKNGQKVKADPKEDAVPITHNFATTVYASQGQTVNSVFIIDSPYMNRRLAYVGMSRHTELCDIYLDCSEISDRLAAEAERKRTGSFKPKSKAPPTEAELAQKREQAEHIRSELSEWVPKLGLAPSDYLKAVAKSWNTDSQNPTPGMAKKRMKEKSVKNAKEGEGAYRPELCPDDDPEDFPEKRFEEPMLFEDLARAHGGLRPAPAPAPAQEEQKSGFFSSFLRKKPAPPPPPPPEPEPAPAVDEPLPDSREPSDLPEWASGPGAAEAIEALRGKAWSHNRYGRPRLFSVDPVKGHARSRWSFAGGLKAGDGEIPVLPNAEHFKEAPWFIVQGAREALISWGHFRAKHKENPAKAPNIAIAFPAANLSTLDKWVKPGSHPLYCAWSPKDPSSLEKALELSERLKALGHNVKVYPKPPEPSAAPAAEAAASAPAPGSKP